MFYQNHITMRKLFYYATFVFSLTLLVSSCNKEDGDGVGPCSVAWATDLQPEWTAVYDAAVAYAQDGSEANCNAYKSAYQDYINALKPYGNCTNLTGQAHANWKQAVEDAEAEVANLCN
jgi:outer membrane receptor for ferrienterochelin and colicin